MVNCSMGPVDYPHIDQKWNPNRRVGNCSMEPGDFITCINPKWHPSRRKFRSQTSDNMDRWKSRGGMRWEESERRRAEEKDQRRERVRRKKMQVDAVVARSTFPSQNVQSTPFSDHFWKLRCWRVHAVVVRSTFPGQNAQKRTILGPLLEVDMSKKCTQLMVLDHFWTFRSRFAWQAQYKRHVHQRC